MQLKSLIQAYKDRVINTRRDLHRIPEVAYTEEKTSAYVADYLKQEGLAVSTGIARYGVVGQLKTGRPGPTPVGPSPWSTVSRSSPTGRGTSRSTRST